MSESLEAVDEDCPGSTEIFRKPRGQFRSEGVFDYLGCKADACPGVQRDGFRTVRPSPHWKIVRPGHPAGVGAPRPGGVLGSYWLRVCPAALVVCSSSTDARVLVPGGGVGAAGRRSDGVAARAAGQGINQRATRNSPLSFRRTQRVTIAGSAQFRGVLTGSPDRHREEHRPAPKLLQLRLQVSPLGPILKPLRGASR